MNQTILDNVAKHILEHGYEVLEWRDDSAGYYAPLLRKVKNGKEGVFLAVNFNTDGSVYCHNFDDDGDGLYIESDGSTPNVDESKGAAASREDSYKRRLGAFTDIYKQLKFENPCKEHRLFQTKNLVPFGRAIKDSHFSYEIGGKKYDGNLHNVIAIPFVSGFDEPVCGLQYRNSDGSKGGLKFSRTKRAFHILSSGSHDRYLGSTLGYLAESVTTAAEIAEAVPNAFVACTGGIGSQLEVYEYIKGARPDMILIAVLDKTKDGFPSPHEKILKRKTRYIQLDVFDTRNNGLTDFNEFALKFGKGAVKREVYRQTMEIYPKMPEVLSYEDGEFKIISAIHGGIETIVHNQINKRINDVMNKEAQKLFCIKSAINIDNIDEHISLKWMRDANRNTGRIPKGQGVFRDRDCIIANLKGGRFMINGKVENVAEMMPISDQLYLNINGSDLSKTPLTKKNFEKLQKAFVNCYGKESVKLFYMLIGFAVQGVLAGISPHRAHAWLTGITGSGKSKIKEYLIEPLTERICLATMDATPAAIDQKLSGNEGHNAVIVTLDECGDETTYKAERVKGLITLACQMAVTDGLGSKLRGTAKQDGKEYNRTASMLFCSQTHSLTDAQDLARFFIFDISKQQLNKKGLDNLLETSKALADKFMYTAITSGETFLELYSEARNRLIDNYERGRDMSHKIQATASVLSGLAALCITIGIYDKEEALDKVFKTMDATIKEHLKDYVSAVTNDIDVLDILLLTPLKADLGIEVPLQEFLSGRDQERMWNEYGVQLGREGRIKLSLTRFKIPLLFKNYSSKRVHISKSKLADMHKNNDRVKRYSTKVGDEYEWIVTIK